MPRVLFILLNLLVIWCFLLFIDSFAIKIPFCLEIRNYYNYYICFWFFFLKLFSLIRMSSGLLPHMSFIILTINLCLIFSLLDLWKLLEFDFFFLMHLIFCVFKSAKFAVCIVLMNLAILKSIVAVSSWLTC